MTMENRVNNTRIAKNTLFLYFRMFIIVAVSLYTSRVVLKTLGISDFGIYNVVGGIITMAGFLNSAMVAASQRFLSYELGRKDQYRLSRVFSTSVNIHLAICVVAFLVAETVGLWFVNTKLNIPTDRMYAANWVFQASIFSFFVNVMSVPYNSAIVAHERMSAFAYISILDVVLRLLVVFLLLIVPFDKLITYSVLTFLVMIFIRYCYTIYCKRNFSECTYHYIFDKKLFKEMFSFAGWSIVGNLGFSFKDQVSNIILNLFYGTTVNAARGVGMQVTSAVKTFAQSFSMALNPQITKQYAAGNIAESRRLVYTGSRYTFFLLSLASVPIIINLDYILALWLETVPEYTNQFVVFSILISLLYGLSECVTKAIQATGRIKWFQIGLSIIMLSELPIAWILMEMNFPPYAVMWPALFTYSVAILFRFMLVCRYVEGYSIRYYLIQVVGRCLIVFAVCYISSYLLCNNLQKDFFGFAISVVLSFSLTLLIIFFLGMLKSERLILVNRIRAIIKEKKCNYDKISQQ